MKIQFIERIQRIRAAIQSIADLECEITHAADVLARGFRSGSRVFACGNGGSAAEAMHLATELSGRYRSNRNPLPAMSLTADGTAITCIGNDFGWDQIFSRQLAAHAKAGDILLAISTSGNSPNVIEALTMARVIGVTTIGLLGKRGGAAKALCDIPIVIGGDDTGAIQEAHLVVIHILCEGLEPESNDL